MKSANNKIKENSRDNYLFDQEMNKCMNMKYQLLLTATVNEKSKNIFII